MPPPNHAESPNLSLKPSSVVDKRSRKGILLLGQRTLMTSTPLLPALLASPIYQVNSRWRY